MVEELRVLCLRVVTDNVTEGTPLERLTRRDLEEACATLRVDLPLAVALTLPLHDLYWRRRTHAHYPPPHQALPGQGSVSLNVYDTCFHNGNVRPSVLVQPFVHCACVLLLQAVLRGGGPPSPGSPAPTTRPSPAHCHPSLGLSQQAVRAETSWRRAYLETHLARAITTTQDTKRGWRALAPVLQLCAAHVRALHLPSLAPSSSSGDGGGLERGSLDHLNLAEVITALPNLQEVSVRYQTLEEAGDLCWPDVGISLQDTTALTQAISASRTITHLRVYESFVDDVRAEAMVKDLQGHKSLTCLDLRHNLLTSTSVLALVTLLASTHLTTLHLQHNNIGMEGARQLGAALTRSPPLEVLLLDLNPVGGEGGVLLLEGAARGGRLQVLSLDGCRLTDQCWMPLAAALTTLRYVSLAANPFTQEPPAEVVAAAEGGSCGARVLLSNLDGTTYLLGRVCAGSHLSPHLQALHEQLAMPLTPAAAQEDLAHYLPLHGVHLRPDNFTIEEELRGMCLFTKNPKNIL
ncbi:uncharacterized protein [Panulirus ornatus]|uniref:uncharacterized protein n=1 Tax=Panulirus ornatus TaxID=150431 RepID=UPI003A8999DA